LSLPLSIYPAMLDGLQAFVAKSVTRTVFLLLRIPALLAVFRTESPLLNMSMVLAATNLVESLVLAGIVYRRLPGLRFAPREVDRATIRAVRGYSFDAFVAMMAGRLAFSTDSFVIGRLLNLVAIAHFRVANTVIDLAKTILRSATTTLTPAISASEAVGDLDAVRSYVLHGTRLSLYLVLPIQLGLFLFGRPFFELWLPAGYAAAATPSMWILNITLALTIAQSVASRVLYGVGRIRLFARITLLEGTVNVALSIGYVLRLLRMPLTRYIREAWRMPLTAAALPVSVWWPLSAGIAEWSWSKLFAIGLAGLAPYAAVVAAIEWRTRRRDPTSSGQRRAA
jgi:O-antigen/teichoic acid export membrane protein